MNPVLCSYVIAATVYVVVGVPALPQEPSCLVPQSECTVRQDQLNGSSVRYRALRAIDDLATHQHWLLIRDAQHASGPALLRQLSDASCLQPGLASGASNTAINMRPLPLIHAGERIIVFAHTAVSDTELEATALEPAAGGDTLRVRLKFAGSTIRTIAVAAGRVALLDGEARRP